MFLALSVEPGKENVFLSWSLESAKNPLLWHYKYGFAMVFSGDPPRRKALRETFTFEVRVCSKTPRGFALRLGVKGYFSLKCSKGSWKMDSLVCLSGGIYVRQHWECVVCARACVF